MWICDPSTNHTATAYSERLDAYLQGDEYSLHWAGCLKPEEIEFAEIVKETITATGIKCISAGAAKKVRESVVFPFVAGELIRVGCGLAMKSGMSEHDVLELTRVCYARACELVQKPVSKVKLASLAH